MEATPEGMAAAQATREAAKRKRAEVAAEQQSRKQAFRPTPSCTHEVALPDESYDVDANKGLDSQVHGECMITLQE